MKINENTNISLPVRNLIALLGAVAMGIFAYTEVTTRLTSLETSRELFNADLLKKSEQLPTDQEQFMLLEFLSKEQDKLKEKIEAEVPNIKKNDMTIQFHEERIIDLEEKNGTH